MNPELRSYGRSGREQGSILVGVLWCVALLAILVVGVLHTSRLDLRVARQQADRIQARYLALAGIEKAKALLREDAVTRGRAGTHHAVGLYDAPQQFKDIPLGRGHYRVIRPPRSGEGSAIVYGVRDEESQLNATVADVAELTKIQGLTPDVAAALVDWRDGNQTVTAGGAEAPYYLALQPPSLPRNAPFQTLRELLMVRGITDELLFGEPRVAVDASSGGRSESGGMELTMEEGWSQWLTVHSVTSNVDASGSRRLSLTSADVGDLTGVRGITPEIARAIVAHRGRNRFESVLDLLDVRAEQRGGPGIPGTGRNSGPTLINEVLLKDIADRFTLSDDEEQSGLVNVNSASVEVLQCLPGLDRRLAEAIVAHRRANGYLQSIADLLSVPGLNRNTLKQCAPRLTTRSETFRILAEGRVGEERVVQRVEAVVHVELQRVTTLAHREDDL